MKPAARNCMAAAMTVGAAMLSSTAMVQAQDAKPNILFIMGDDIGWMQPSIYHRVWQSARRPTSTASAVKVRSS